MFSLNFLSIEQIDLRLIVCGAIVPKTTAREKKLKSFQSMNICVPSFWSSSCRLMWHKYIIREDDLTFMCRLKELEKNVCPWHTPRVVIELPYLSIDKSLLDPLVFRRCFNRYQVHTTLTAEVSSAQPVFFFTCVETTQFFNQFHDSIEFVDCRSPTLSALVSPWKPVALAIGWSLVNRSLSAQSRWWWL